LTHSEQKTNMDRMDDRDRLALYPFVIVRMACRVCSRKGSYRLAQLAAKYGPEISLRDLTDKFSYDCLWRSEGRSKKGKSACGVYLPDLEQKRPPDLPPVRHGVTGERIVDYDAVRARGRLDAADRSCQPKPATRRGEFLQRRPSRGRARWKEIAIPGGDHDEAAIAGKLAREVTWSMALVGSWPSSQAGRAIKEAATSQQSQSFQCHRSDVR
jgi:hypothetical protein